MVTSQSFTAIALHQEPIKVEDEKVNIKLFANDREEDVEEDYFESFFNVDLRNGFAFWNEKDLDYRKPLIRGLSETPVT
jgi:hypothetical protein